MFTKNPCITGAKGCLVFMLVLPCSLLHLQPKCISPWQFHLKQTWNKIEKVRRVLQRGQAGQKGCQGLHEEQLGSQRWKKNQHSSQKSCKEVILTQSRQYLIPTLEHTTQPRSNLTEDCRSQTRSFYSKHQGAPRSHMLLLKPLLFCAAAKNRGFPWTSQPVKRSSKLERTLAGQSSHAQLWSVCLFLRQEKCGTKCDNVRKPSFISFITQKLPIYRRESTKGKQLT